MLWLGSLINVPEETAGLVVEVMILMLLVWVVSPRVVLTMGLESVE